MKGGYKIIPIKHYNNETRDERRARYTLNLEKKEKEYIKKLKELNKLNLDERKKLQSITGPMFFSTKK